MRKITLFVVFALLIFCGSVSAQGKSGFGYRADPFAADEARIKKVLMDLFPDDPEAAGIEIKIVDKLNGSNFPNLTADINCRCAISMTKSMLKRMRGRTDVALAFAHEFGHIKLHHVSARTIVGGSLEVWDYDLLERQEISADYFAARALERSGADACPTLLPRLVKEFGIDKVDDPRNAVIMKRVALQKVYCFNKGKIRLLDPFGK
ncbi:MAG: hypothetical protein Q8P49_04685 [Candidatus Liptonbacteria bacterium]|nr:hypothetical protein [Candidatus Liptonbacteria bacterium]